jgi:ribosome biogenesis GTPase
MVQTQAMRQKASKHMQGKIIKGIAGFYYVHVVESGIYECKAKGVFRKEKIKPLVGDDVKIEVLDETEKEGNIIEVHPRKNELIRPAVANIDQALVVFAVTEPEPHFNLLDRFLVMMESKNINVILCFNKKDIATLPELARLQEIYRACGYQVIFTSALEQENIVTVNEVLDGKTTVIAGPSGVGKSSLINLLQSEIQMETGTISKKISRGKHTTRHSELITIDEKTYIMDTPGFSSLYVNDFDKSELKYHFREFIGYEGKCRFNSCDHIHEPGCAVKEAVDAGDIHQVRYADYLEMYKELQGKKRY